MHISSARQQGIAHRLDGVQRVQVDALGAGDKALAQRHRVVVKTVGVLGQQQHFVHAGRRVLTFVDQTQRLGQQQIRQCLNPHLGAGGDEQARPGAAIAFGVQLQPGTRAAGVEAAAVFFFQKFQRFQIAQRQQIGDRHQRDFIRTAIGLDDFHVASPRFAQCVLQPFGKFRLLRRARQDNGELADGGGHTDRNAGRGAVHFQRLQRHEIASAADQVADVAFQLLRVSAVAVAQLVDDRHAQQPLLGVLHQVLVGDARVVFAHGFQHIQKGRFGHALVELRKAAVRADFLDQRGAHAASLRLLLGLVEHQPAADRLDLQRVVKADQMLAQVARAAIVEPRLDAGLELLERLLQGVGHAVHLALQIGDLGNHLHQQRLGKAPALGPGAIDIHFLQMHALRVQQAVGRAQQMLGQQAHARPFLHIAQHARLGLLFGVAGTHHVLVAGFEPLVQRLGQGNQEARHVPGRFGAHLPFVDQFLLDAAANLARHILARFQLGAVEAGHAQRAVVFLEALFAQLGQLVEPGGAVALAHQRLEVRNHRLPLADERFPALVGHVFRQDAERQRQVVVRQQPALLRFLLLHKLVKVLLARLVNETRRRLPVVKAQLQRRLPGKAVGQVFADFLFRNGEALDAEGQETLGALGASALRRGFGRAVAVFSVFHAAQRRPVDVVDGDDLLVQKVGDDARQIAVYINRQAVLVFVAKDEAAVERVAQREPLLHAGHVVRLVAAHRQGVEFGERGKTVGVVVAGVPVRVRVGVGQQRIDQDAKAPRVGIQVAQLRHCVNHAAAARAASQPQHDVKGHVSFAALLQLLDLRLHLFAVVARLAGKQKAPQPALLPAQRGADDAVENVAPGIRAAQPVLETGITVEVVKARGQVGVGN